MQKRSVTHATFVIKRIYDAAPARVFAAFATAEAKRRWFKGPDDWESGPYELDFRVGGREFESGGPRGAPSHTYEATFRDIVPNERIVTSYVMHLGETKISVSLATVELRPEGAGTRLTLTELGAYLDGYDDAGAREHGTGELLDALGASLKPA